VRASSPLVGFDSGRASIYLLGSVEPNNLLLNALYLLFLSGNDSINLIELNSLNNFPSSATWFWCIK
jgi:hypothetical protein